MSLSVKFDFPLDEVLIRQTITMPNGIPFSQMTTEHTRRVFEGDLTPEDKATRLVDLAETLSSRGWGQYERICKHINDQMREDEELMKEKFEEEAEELKEKNKELEAENERLKAENSYLENWNIDKLNENYVPLEDYEKLKEEFAGWKSSYDDDIREARAEGIDELKDDILYYRMYVYSIDPCADCTPEKEHIDSFTDDPQQRKTLYERIGYESDDEEDEQYMYDVRSEDCSITYYLGYDLDEARKHAGGRGLKILRYIVEDGEPNTDDWEIVE